MVALSLEARRPTLFGPDLIDASGRHHVGLFPAGLPILTGTAAEIARAHELAADQPGVLVIDFPSDGQTTTDYVEFGRLVAGKQPEELSYLGVTLHGQRTSSAVLPGAFLCCVDRGMSPLQRGRDSSNHAVTTAA